MARLNTKMPLLSPGFPDSLRTWIARQTGTGVHWRILIFPHKFSYRRAERKLKRNPENSLLNVFENSCDGSRQIVLRFTPVQQANDHSRVQQCWFHPPNPRRCSLLEVKSDTRGGEASDNDHMFPRVSAMAYRSKPRAALSLRACGPEPSRRTSSLIAIWERRPNRAGTFAFLALYYKYIFTTRASVP
jgi:hypothetical protein